MRIIASATAAAMFISLVVPAGAATFGNSGLTTAAQEMSSIDLVAAKAKAKKKGKKKAGPKTHKFCVQTLSPWPWTKGTCSAKNANKEAARATCQVGNAGFVIRDFNKKTCR